MVYIKKGHGLPCYSMVYVKKGHGLPRYFMFQPKYLTILNEFREIHCYSTTMVDHGQTRSLTMVNHDWPCSFSQSIWPWSTMVSLVSFNVHGRPWSNHGHTMDKPWFTMVAVHEQPCSKHGWPWSNRGPDTGVIRP